MDDFPLCNLYPTLMEKIVSKLDWKSYYRIQQTCRDMGEFIRTNRKISISVPKEFYVQWCEDEDGLPYLRPDPFPDKSPHNLESLYGVRLTQFGAELETDKDFEGFCAQLKKYRFTCELLHVYLFDAPLRKIRGPKKEQYVEMYKILQPSRILMNSEDSNLYETIATWKKLKAIEIDMTLGEVLPALQIMVHLSEITLTVQENSTKSFSHEQFCSTMKEILQFLRSPLPNLRRFHCEIYCDIELSIPIEERLQSLSDFNPIYLAETPGFAWFYDESRLIPPLFEVGLSPVGGIILFRQ